MAKVIVRPATSEDIAAFAASIEITPTVKAWVGEIDGAIVALGGLALVKGRWFAFLDLTEEARPYKMTLMRTARRLMAEARRQGIRFVYAERDLNEAGSETWLKSLGFEIDPRSEHYYRWNGKS